MSFRSPTLLAAGAAAAVLASSGSASAHLRAAAKARLDVVVDADGTVKALRHVWQFDDAFSNAVLSEFDANGDLKLDDAELQEVSDTIFSSIAEFNYFQHVTADGHAVAMKPPASLMVNFDDQQLLVLFESEPQEPLHLKGKVHFAVYDPTFYTALDFTDDAYMAVDRMPPGCTRAVVRPDPEKTLEENETGLTDALLDDPTGADVTKFLATRLELDCPTKS